LKKKRLKKKRLKKKKKRLKKKKKNQGKKKEKRIAFTNMATLKSWKMRLMRISQLISQFLVISLHFQWMMSLQKLLNKVSCNFLFFLFILK
jgi:hypothetical protein